jgi:MFS family permease
MNLGLALNLLSAYQMTLWIALIPMIFGVLTIVPMAVDRPENKKRIGIGNVRNRGFIGKYALMWTVSGFGAGLFVQLYNLFFNLAFAADAATIGIMFAASTIVMAAGNFLSPIIVDRYGKFWTIVWCHLLSIPFLLVLAWSPFLYIAFIGFVSRNLFMNVAWPVMDVFYMEGLDKDEQSTAMGVITMGDSLVRGVALNVAGWLFAAGFLRAPFALASIFYLLSVLLFYYFFRDEKSETPVLE